MKKNKSVVRAWNKEQARLSKRATFGVMLPLLLGVGAAIWQGWALAVFVAALLAHAATAHVQALWAFVGASVLRILLGIWQGEARLRAGQQARRRLRQSLLQRIQADGPALLRRQHSAALGTLLGERIEALDGYFGNWLPASSSWVLAQLLVIGAVLWVNWRAGLVLLAFCGLMPIFQACFGIATARASRREFLAMARLQTRFLDRMRGIATIVLSGRIWSEARVMETASHDLRQRTMKVLRVAFLTSAATDFAMVGALVVIVVSQSRILLHHPAFSPLGLSQPEGPQVFQTASALFALFMVPEAFVPVRRLAAAYQDRAKGAAMAEAVAALGPLPVGADQPVGSGPVGPMSTGVVPVPEAWGISVAFKQVSYRWSPDRPEALQEISFVLPPGKTLILEGASGAGKTTLLELLIGFIQAQKGEVLLGGENIAHISPNDLTPLIAWIGQKPVLFSGSLKENILFGNPDAGEEEVQAALQAAGIASFLPLLPAGLETRVGEGGYGLSGGQAQRVAIARAWLKNAPLLVLDEPTSHLDPQTEQGIVKALEKLMQNRTVVLTTHSPAFRALPAALRGELSHGRLILDGLKREEREASL